MRVNEYHTCDSLLTAGASSLHDARKKYLETRRFTLYPACIAAETTAGQFELATPISVPSQHIRSRAGTR
jgi:hypothetical protein